MSGEETSLESAIEELERSSRLVSQLAEQLRTAPESVGSAEVLDLANSAEVLAAEVQAVTPSEQGD